MSRIGYGYGSEWHLLRWLGYHRTALSRHVAELIGAHHVEWRDFRSLPAANDPLKRDYEWVDLDFIPDERHPARVAWRETWPRAWGGSGPHWDAVGVATAADAGQWVLVEAKANVAEVTSNISAGVATSSLATIESAFAAVAPSFGVTDTARWLHGGYQIANRLCALDVMNHHDAPAHLVLIYFCGDRASQYRRGRGAEGRSGVYCPRDEADWRASVLDGLHARMGWHPGQGPLGYRVHELFLPVEAAPSRF